MSKFTLFITALYVSLCPMGTYAQEVVRQVMSINEMFALADQNSKSLRPYATGIVEAREGVRVAKNARLPEIDASLSFSYLGDGRMMDRDFSNGFNAPMPHYGNNFAIEASQAIYTGGAVSNGIAIARLQEENANLSLDANRNKVRFMLVGYYLDLFKQQNQLRVYEKNIGQARQVLRDLRAKEEEGIVLKNDITRYELLLSNLELTHTQIRNGITILNQNLTTTLGLSADIAIAPDTTILAQVLPIEDKESWTTTASANSPQLKQMSLALQMTKHQDKIIRSERIPKIALFAGNRFDGPVIIEVPPINKNFNYWYVGVGVKYASFIRHPFIALATFRFKAVYQTFLLYIVVDILLSPSHVLEHAFMEGVLGYDSLNVVSLNWVILAGTIVGSVFTYLTFPFASGVTAR